MSTQPDWLPPLIDLNGDWVAVESKLHKIFSESFLERTCFYEAKRVFVDKRKIESSYEEGFWHLITRMNYQSGNREPDFRRAERLSWAKAIIENNDDQAVLSWDHPNAQGGTRRMLWLKDYDYVVVLIDRVHAWYIVSGYHVDGSRTRKQLQAGYDQYGH